MEWTKEFHDEIVEGLTNVKDMKGNVSSLCKDMAIVKGVVVLLKGNGTTGFFKRVENLEKVFKARFDKYVAILASLISLGLAIKVFFFS